VLSSGEAFEIQSPQSYLAQLEGEFVLADVEVRRQKIRKALDKVTREVKGRAGERTRRWWTPSPT
jgi:glycyl-tRNA synthetase beta chain